MFTVHNDENAAQGRGRNKQENSGIHQKRTALGTITNRTRVQPFRNAKGLTAGSDQENISIPNDKNKQFIDLTVKASEISVFVEPTQPKYHEQELKEPTKLLSQSLYRVAETITIKDDSPSMDITCKESPMVLDISDEKIDSKKTCDIITDVPEYAEEIYAYLRESEQRNRAKSGYMRKQPDITSSMRSILVDWLVEVGEEYTLHRETLFLTVNYVDRFLSQMSVLRGKLQLVGAASMFLAAKYEEIYPPDVGEFVYITDNTYTQKQVLRMEHLILKVLQFDVAVPTINWFCDKFLKLSEAEDRVKSLAMYLCELTLVDCEPFMEYLPSQIAASAVCLAYHTFNLPSWTSSMQRCTGHSVSDLMTCMRDLHLLMKAAPAHAQQAVQEKYSSSTHHEVSQIEAPPSLPS